MKRADHFVVSTTAPDADIVADFQAGTGAGAQILIVTLENLPTISASDFIVT